MTALKNQDDQPFSDFDWKSLMIFRKDKEEVEGEAKETKDTYDKETGVHPGGRSWTEKSKSEQFETTGIYAGQNTRVSEAVRKR